MKRSKWLLIAFVLLLAVVGGFTWAVRSGWSDEYIRHRIEREASAALHGEVTVGQLSANDRSAFIFDIHATLPDSLGTVSVKRLYVRYNLWRFLFTGLRIDGVVEHVSIEEPHATINLTAGHKSSAPKKEESKPSAPLALPDLAGYFQGVTVTDGSVELLAGDSLVGVTESIRNIDAEIENTAQTRARLRAALAGGTLEAEGEMAGGQLRYAQADVRGLRPTGVHLPVVEALDFALSASVRLEPDTLHFEGRIDSVRVDVAQRSVRGTLLFGGNTDLVRLRSENLVVDGQHLLLNTELRKPFEAEQPLAGNVRGQIEIGRLTPDVSGRVQVDVELGGTVGAPRVRARASSDSISAGGETLYDVRAGGNWQPSGAEFALKQAIWRGNTIYGHGTLDSRGNVEAWIDSDSLHYEAGEWAISGYARTRLELSRGKLRGEAEVFDLAVRGGPVDVRGIGMKARYGQDRLRIDLQDADRRLVANASASLADTTASVNIDFRRFPLSGALEAGSHLPSLSGTLTVNASPRNLQLTSGIRVFDSHYGQLDGFLETTAAIDFAHNRTFLSVHTQHGVYNYEPFSFKLLADGTLDSLATRYATINDEVDMRLWVTRKPQLDLGLRLEAPRVPIQHYLAYFMDSYNARQYGGNVELEVVYNARGKKKVVARARTEGIKAGGLEDLAFDLSLTGDTKQLKLDRSRVMANGKTVVNLTGTVDLQNASYRINAINQKLVLQEVFPQMNMAGNLRLQCTAFQHPQAGQGLDVRLNGLDCEFFGIAADTLDVELTQREKLLTVHRLYVRDPALYVLEGEGAIAYNLLNNKAFSDSVSLRLHFLGDPFRIVSNTSPAFEKGRGLAEFDMNLSVRDEHLSMEQGKLEVKTGRITIAGQPERIENLKLLVEVERNIVNIRHFKFDMGEGRVYIGNDHTDVEKSLALGQIDIGSLWLHTDDEGILVDVPQYTPEGSVVRVRIAGRDDDESLRVTGPLDDLSIVGDVYLSDGEAIFPPNVQNLMDFVTGKAPASSGNEEVDLPLRFDIMIHVTDHMRYVTRPADFELKPDSFLHLVYDGEMFVVPEAVFTCENGTAEAFGTVFYVDFLQIQISQFNPLPRISGALYRKAADGSLITLRLMPAGEDAPGTWVIELTSDDPADETMMDIMAKLRYNRSRDELTPQQQQSLLQDEALDMAGVEIESALLDPLISPLENRIRRLLRLDSFTMRPSVVRNLFSEYAGTGDPNAPEADRGQEEILQTGAGLLLNNLSINMGKYVYRNFYLDYELLVQETTDIESMDLKLNHTFTLRYDLPWRLKLSYKYIIDREAEENNHEVLLERSFRF